MAELVHVRRREKTNRKIMEVTDSCFKNYLMQNHCLRVYFDLTRSKDFNKMNPLEIILRLIMVVLDHIKTQEMCIDAVHIESGSLLPLSLTVLKHKKYATRQWRNPYTLRFVPD